MSEITPPTLPTLVLTPEQIRQDRMIDILLALILVAFGFIVGSQIEKSHVGCPQEKPADPAVCREGEVKMDLKTGAFYACDEGNLRPVPMKPGEKK